MKDVIFFKVKKIGNEWHAIFVKENDEYIIINNNRDELRNYLKENKDSIFIGANNFLYDDMYLASIIKNGNIGELLPGDLEKYLPRTLDITEGINDTIVDFNSLICNINLPNFYATNANEINEELVNKVFVIKRLYDLDERKKYLNWKLDLINKYHLSKESYHASFSSLMKSIIGLEIKEDEVKSGKFTLDSNVLKELQSRNDPFLNELLKDLTNYYQKSNDVDESKTPTRIIGNCPVIFNKHGVHGTRKTDYFDADGDYSYLYIDFNSFGPSILINNKWLNDVSKHGKRYEEIRDIRFDLKAKKQPEQMFYKHMLNEILDSLYKTYSNGNNVGISITVSGIMTMMILYRTIEKYGIEILEANTDGFIVKCSKKSVPLIKKDVEDLANKLKLSCDADDIKRIIHFDDRNYIMEYADDKIKHIGVFGIVLDHPLYKSGISAVDEAIRNYYLFNVPVSETLRSIRDNGNIEAFQIVKKDRSNEKVKYLELKGKYMEVPYRVNRLFPVTLDKLTNTLYIKDNRGNFAIYNQKKGTSVKEGYYYFEVADRTLPNINDIDLTYYIDKCYKTIDAHPKKKNICIASSAPNKFAFVDADGTIVKDSSETTKYKIFCDAVSDILDEKDIEPAYYLFSKMSGSFIVQFLSICKKYKGYGTISNFALFLKEKELFPGIKDINVYKRFVKRYLDLDLEFAKEIVAHNNSKEALEILKSDGYTIILYSNWFKDTQIAKLQANKLDIYFDKICTIDDYYAKSTVVGWKDILTSTGVKDKDIRFMLGNGSSDMTPKSVNVPSIIVNHDNRQLAQTVRKSGIIIPNFNEIVNGHFDREMEEIIARNRR